MARYDLSEAEWRLVEPLLPPAGRGPRRVDDRRVVNAIFYVLRTGSPCRLAMVRVMSVVPSRYCAPS